METTKSKILYSTIIIAVAVLLVLPFCFAKNISPVEITNRNWVIPITYAVVTLMSLGVLIGYCTAFKKKYFWLLLTMISVCICDIGHLALSLSSALPEALLANKIAYFGNCFLPLFLLVTIADACRFRYCKTLVHILFAISCVMFIFVATTGYLDIFYKTVEFEMENGIAIIRKTYGLMHTFYAIYVVTYFALMLSVIIYSSIKGKLVSWKHVVTLLMVVFVNTLLWLIEKFIYLPFEMLSFSYAITSLITIFAYKQLISFGLLDFYNISLDRPNEEKRTIDTFEEVEEVGEEALVEHNLASYGDGILKGYFKNLPLETSLSDREIEIAILMIKNIKRKKIADFLFITEHTVKFHISNIYKKTNVNSKSELADLIKSHITNHNN